ncbi:MAG: pyrroline-5-carboxylate reductase [Syntrophobacteraceae bacterium]|nr:pyrroline-5-carboxylate reductase [Syntrophobacteraceae bacterium]
MFEQIHLGFVGGGNMGEALIKGLLQASLVSPDRIHVYDISSSRTRHLRDSYGIRPSREIASLASESQIIVLAVKPQNMHQVLADLRGHLAHGPMVLSIAAGIPISTLVSSLPEGLPVVRVMPNTPALVLSGASALSRCEHVTDEQMQTALSLFRAVGKAVEVEEKWMDAVTGLSGSGPAYILLLIEGFIDAGVLMGLPRHVAAELVLQTVEGTVRMVRETTRHPAELKDMITSPGGTTIAGLKVLEERAVRGALMEAVRAATSRSGELGRS